MKPILIVLLFVLLVASSATAQSVSNSEQLIRSAVETADWTIALSELNKLRATDPNTFRSKGYDYLQARVSEKSGDTATAVAGYQSVVNANSPLAPYALWHLAEIARANGDLILEREHLRKLVNNSPQSLLFNSATLRLAKSFFESSDFNGAADSARVITTTTNVALSRESSSLLGQSLLRLGKETAARDIFAKLIMQMPDASRPDDFALTAARELDALDQKNPNTKLSEADHLLRASIYQFNRDFTGARIHYRALIDTNPQAATAPNAIYQLARGQYLEGKYNDALLGFQRVVDQFPQSTTARDALTYVAASYLRLQRTDDGVKAYEQFITRFPDAPNPERPYLNIIDALHEAGRYPGALSWVKQARTRFKNQLGGALALFAQLRIHLAQNNWPASVADADDLLRLSDLGGARAPGGTTPAEVNFLRAYALEQQGRIDEAITSYLSISDGRNEYYGARATLRLQNLKDMQKSARLNSLLAAAKTASAGDQFEQARVALQSALRLTSDQKIRAGILNDLRTAYSSLPAYNLPTFSIDANWNQTTTNDSHKALAVTLASLGLYEEAIPEFVAKPQSNSSATANNTNYTLAVFALRGGLGNRAVRFAEQAWKNVPADFVIELASRDLISMLYPVPFRDVLLQHTTSRNVDPRFVLSIARQESRFQPEAKSVAAARGMMQFISSTANDIAAQLKLKTFDQDDLYEPNTAILFGSQYLANLFQQFPGQPDAVAAAYNGGADNMLRWRARSKSAEPDRYVPEIGYSQSKDYVYRVMSNFWSYQHLYDSQLRPLLGNSK